MTSYKILPSTRNLFKSTMLIIAIQSILWLLFVNKSFAFDHNISQDILKNNFRGSIRKLVDTSQKVDCTYPDNNNICVCPGTCMENEKNTTYCKVEHCFKWDLDEKTCKKTGKDHTAPLVLSAIPFTSVLGIGYGVLERWDLFGMQMGILFGPCLILCLCTCVFLTKKDDPDSQTSEGIMDCGMNCITCIWSIIILIMYVFSIIWTATPNAILDGSGCPLSGF